jgi:hypothetical protein
MISLHQIPQTCHEGMSSRAWSSASYYTSDLGNVFWNTAVFSIFSLYGEGLRVKAIYRNEVTSADLITNSNFVTAIPVHKGESPQLLVLVYHQIETKFILLRVTVRSEKSLEVMTIAKSGSVSLNGGVTVDSGLTVFDRTTRQTLNSIILTQLHNSSVQLGVCISVRTGSAAVHDSIALADIDLSVTGNHPSRKEISKVATMRTTVEPVVNLEASGHGDYVYNVSPNPVRPKLRKKFDDSQERVEDLLCSRRPSNSATLNNNRARPAGFFGTNSGIVYLDSYLAGNGYSNYIQASHISRSEIDAATKSDPFIIKPVIDVECSKRKAVAQFELESGDSLDLYTVTQMNGFLALVRTGGDKGVAHYYAVNPDDPDSYLELKAKFTICGKINAMGTHDNQNLLIFTDRGIHYCIDPTEHKRLSDVALPVRYEHTVEAAKQTRSLSF